MKRVKFNKKSLLIFILILGIGTTLAYFTSNISIPNIFNSARYETTTTEEFTSPSDWKPGDTTPKTVVTKNNSNLPIRVRISVEENWTDKNNNNLSLEENNTLAAILDLDNRPDWIYEDGYYYYRYDVAPGESTNSFIKSVTFNKDIVGEYVCVTENNNEQCDSASDTYQDANYKLNIKVETTQADNYMDAWGLEHAPRRVDPTYCTYDEELTPGAEYVNGQYTYIYKKRIKDVRLILEDMEENGWSVYLTDRESTNPVTTPLCTYINDIPVISASYMFYNSKASSIDTSTFDTSEIKHMNSMFYKLQNVTEIDVSNFETGNTTNMSNMFRYCEATSLDLSSFDTSNVTNMGGMFANTKFTSIDLSNFDTSNVTNMTSMFASTQLTSIDLSHFDTSNVTTMMSMFNSSSFTTLDLNSFDTSKVTTMNQMFAYTQVPSLDLRNFDTSNVTNMSDMFAYTKATSLDLRGFNTKKVTTMYQMFVQANDLEEIKGIEDFDTSRVTNFMEMFWHCYKLKRLDLKKWNTQSATANLSLARMFYYCTSLEYLDVSNFDTSHQVNMNRTLAELEKLPSLNLTNWDTSNFTIMYAFIGNNHFMEEYDLSSFDTSNVTDMTYLFHKNWALRKIYISDLWDTSKVTSNQHMFYEVNNLTGDINNRYTMKPRINELTLSDTSTRTIHVGESITIPTVTATYTDNSVVTKNSEDLIWKSSDLDIAKANLGVVKGISPGEATITVKSGIVETTFNVVVVE